MRKWVEPLVMGIAWSVWVSICAWIVVLLLSIKAHAQIMPWQLNATDTPADTECACYDSTTEKFEWMTSTSADNMLKSVYDIANNGRCDASDDLICTNCIGPTELADIALGTDTTGNYADGDAEHGNALNANNLNGQNLGTLTDTKFCVYDLANTAIDCNSDGGSAFGCGDIGACTVDADTVEGTDFGTLTNGKTCTYDLANTEVDCNTTPFACADIEACATNADALEGVDLGTLTDTKVCTYDLANTEIDCNTTITPFGCSDIEACTTNADALEGVDLGTLTDGKTCTYDLTNTEIDCNTTPFACSDIEACNTNADNLEGVDWGTLTDGKTCVYDNAGTEVDCNVTPAPTGADYLVGTSNADLSNEIVVGATPGGVLGGTWAAPTLDNDAVDIQDHLKDTDCNTPNAIIKKNMAGTQWDCGTDSDAGAGLNIDRTLWVALDGHDYITTPGDCATLPCCTIGHPCLTPQTAINEATELIPPVSKNHPAEARLAPGIYYISDAIQFFNTNAASASYMQPAHGMTLNGGAHATIAPGTTMSADECLVDISGTNSFALRSLGLSIPIGSGARASAICSVGGFQGFEPADIDILTVGDYSRGFNIRGPGNMSMEMNRMRDTADTVTAYKGRHDHWEVGQALDGALNGTTDVGACLNESGAPHATCVTNNDCGGICNDLSGSASGKFCTQADGHDDCTTSGACTLGVCYLQSSDVLIRDSLITVNQGFVFDKIRTCLGGASASNPSAGTDTVEVAGTADCENYVGTPGAGGVGECNDDFSTEPVTLSCDTNSDCKRYVSGTNTNFMGADNLPNTPDDEVKFGEGIIVNPGASQERRTVRMVISDNLLEVTYPFSTNDAASLSYRTSNDGRPCTTNSDCSSGGTTGTCTDGIGGTVQHRFSHTKIDMAGGPIDGSRIGGECVDGNYDTDLPVIGCLTNADCSGSSPAGDLCQAIGIKVNGSFQVDFDHSTLSGIPLLSAVTKKLVAINGATISTSNTGYANSEVAAATGAVFTSPDDGHFNSVASVSVIPAVGTTWTTNVFWDAGALSVDGTQCSLPAEVTLVSSGPRKYGVICRDDNTATIYGAVNMRGSHWDAGTVQFGFQAVNTAAGTPVEELDFACQCHGDGEALNSTWTEPTNGATLTFAAAGTEEQSTLTDATTCSGTCAANDTIYFRGQVDATATGTIGTTAQIIGVTMQYAITSLN